MKRGKFITLEGVEGAGKSTQARRLHKFLTEEANIPAILTREPGGPPGSEAIRELLLSGIGNFLPRTEVLLHFAARAEHVGRLIRPMLTEGVWVVCDRYIDSTMAYQGYAMGAQQMEIKALGDMVALRPDLTFVLDIPVETTVERLSARDGAADRYEQMGKDFFSDVRRGFIEIASVELRCAYIDGTRSEDAIADSIIRILQSRLGHNGRL